MNQEREKTRAEGLRLAVAITYTLLIFALLPIFPTLWGALSERFPETLKAITYGLPPLFVILFLSHGLFIKRYRDPLFYVMCLGIFLIYGLVVAFICKYPAERFHMVEYGGLVFLVHWSLKHRIKTARIYPAILSYAFAIGLADELVQAVLPNRVYEFKDVATNWTASLLAAGLLIIAAWRRSRGGYPMKEERRT